MLPMKLLKCRRLSSAMLSVFAIVLVFTSVGMSQTSQPESNCEKRVSSLGVSITSDAAEFTLTKGKSISLTIRVLNASPHSVRLLHPPVFNIFLAGVNESRPKFDEAFTGRFSLDSAKGSREILIKPHDEVSFDVDLSTLEIKDVVSSVDVWRNIFVALPSGKYQIEAEATFICSDDTEDQWERRSERISLQMGS